MPEGHTLFRLAADLRAAFAGRPVRVDSPQGRFTSSAALVDGVVLETAESAGKHLFLGFANDHVVHVHLGLIGSFRLGPAPAPPPVGAVRLRLESDDAYADLRGATVCELIDEPKARAITTKLGADPLRLDADPERAFARIRTSTKPIGALLMDQAVLAGVGNVYRRRILVPRPAASPDTWQAGVETAVECSVVGSRAADGLRGRDRANRHRSTRTRTGGNGARIPGRQPRR